MGGGRRGDIGVWLGLSRRVDRTVVYWARSLYMEDEDDDGVVWTYWHMLYEMGLVGRLRVGGGYGISAIWRLAVNASLGYQKSWQASDVSQTSSETCGHGSFR